MAYHAMTLPIEEQDPWIAVQACPACGKNENPSLGLLNVNVYSHGDENVEVPEGGIQILQCEACALVFKDILPSPQLLTAIFTRQAGNVWTDNYSFRSEKKIFASLIGSSTVDILDIGASNGSLLRELEGEGRRSALDVVKHPGLEDHLHGEFIRGLLDSEELIWSGEPYDIVTMFDVAEHLYRPDLAFANLHRLVKPKGFVVIETGDVDSTWPQRYGARRWWYACLFEHHVLWSEQSLNAIARKHGFDIVSVQRKRHKGRTGIWLRRDAMEAAKVVLYRATIRGYEWIAQATGKKGTQPRSPLARDHIRVVLRRN